MRSVKRYLSRAWAKAAERLKEIEAKIIPSQHPTKVAAKRHATKSFATPGPCAQFCFPHPEPHLQPREGVVALPLVFPLQALRGGIIPLSALPRTQVACRPWENMNSCDSEVQQALPWWLIILGCSG